MPSFNSVLCSLVVVGSFVQAVTAGNVFEKLHGGVPQGWTFVKTAGPDHAKYGQHLEGHEVKAMLQPTEAATNAVISWLQDFNITAIEDDGDWVNFKTDVATADKMLDTRFQWFRSDYKGLERLRTLQYSVPDEVAQHINLVQPTTRFGSMKAMRSLILKEEVEEAADGQNKMWTESAATPAAVNISCNATITPQCLLELYNIHYKADPNNGNKVGFASFLEEYARYSDLATFEAQFAPYAIGQNFSVVEFNGGLNDQASAEDSGEANLDLDYIVGLSSPVPVTEFSTGGRGPLVPDLDQPTQADNENEPYLDYLTAILKLPNSELPQTISHSYGENEQVCFWPLGKICMMSLLVDSFLLQSVPASFAKQVCNMFAQLGARGVSVLFSSGDSGVGAACLSNDGLNTTQFQPAFPAACPFLTSVGGTRYIKPEVAIYFSGGGFSRLFPRPFYQELAIREYLAQLGTKNAGFFNRNGRGYPDVAAQAYRFSVVDKGLVKRYQGTSCSSPTFAAVVALLNSARLSSKLPPLGFLNPWIYTVGRFGLNDITSGGNTGCTGNSSFGRSPNGSPVIPNAGFPALKGWDAVTGYGTPDFGKLLKLSTPWVKNKGGPV
ncbi:MAG: hypothetical protein Q9187_001071 [Circinaria calcarea]